MGTRSVVAVPQGDGWKGRYVHWDGYPEGVGAALRVIIARDGLETAVRTLTEEHRGWSSINAEEAPEDRGEPARFAVVPGYGVAYTDQEQADEWITTWGDDWGTEWAYVLYPGRIAVFENVPDARQRWQLRDEIRYDEQLILLDTAQRSGHLQIVHVTDQEG